MPHNAFRKQASALENEFFQEVEEELMIELYQRSATDGAADTVANVTGIADKNVLDELQSVQITPKTLMAFSLFPAIHVAWADGNVESAEKAALLKSAEQLGLVSTSPAFRLLQSWLCRKPAEELFHAWTKFVHAARPVLSDAAFQELRSAATKRARGIAEAAGGLLGFHKVSKAEEAAIAEMEAVFAHALPPVY